MSEESEQKVKNPPNLFRIGKSWYCEFKFKGELYRTSLGAISKSMAKERVARLKTEVATGKLAIRGKVWNGFEWVAQAQPIEDLLFIPAIDKFLEWYRTENAEYTYRKYAAPSAKQLKEFFGEYRLSQISLVLIEKYKRTRKAAGKSDVTCNRELTLLRHFFNKAIDFKMASSNPFRTVQKLADGSYRIQKVRLFKEQGRERFLDEKQSQRLLDECNGDLKIVVLCAMHTGFRASELRSLRWGNVNLANASITVINRYSKNGDTRTIPLSDDLLDALTKLKEERKPEPNDLVFTRNGQEWRCWKEAFNAAVKRAGIVDFHFHDLRHCFGSNLGMNNINPKLMMKLMGHRTPAMTMRYTHLSLDYERQAVAKLPRLSISETESYEKSYEAETAKVLTFSK